MCLQSELATLIVPHPFLRRVLTEQGVWVLSVTNTVPGFARSPKLSELRTKLVVPLSPLILIAFSFLELYQS